MTATATPDLVLLPVPDVLDGLSCSSGGLTSEQARTRLDASGPNALSVRRTSTLWSSVARQLTHPLALLLWVAAILAATTQGPALACAILAVIALNAGFAVVQERHAEHAVEALASYLPPHATVVRNGARTEVAATDVVPGDLLVIEEGAAVCADVKLLSGAVELDMSSVTGESAPVVRQADEAATTESSGRPARVIDASDVALSGTTCTSGDALGVVVHTGMATELGRIATLSGRPRTESSPLEQQVRRVAWIIAAVATGIGVAFLPLGVAAGLSWSEASVFAIGLLVANVPEGLLPTITLALAVGVADLARRGGLVKRLSAIETLGSTDVICTDKTGTLTQNRMHLQSVWDATGDHPPSPSTRHELAVVIAACSTADLEAGSGDPTELALLEAASSWMPTEEFAAGPHLGSPGSDHDGYRVLRFDPRLRLMTVVSNRPGDPARTAGSGPTAMTKGAPEAVLGAAAHVLTGDGDVVPLRSSDRSAILARLEALADRGLRLIACARRDLDPSLVDRDRARIEEDLTLVGFVALSDPVREAVPAAVAGAHAAGITVHVITGDNGSTAAAVASAAGIGAWRGPGALDADGRDLGKPGVVTGLEVDSMSEAQLDALLASGRETVFARSTPENKLRIASRLQAAGHVVAMTGDGVNDAPALRQADIGVAMGRSGTDVAREAATMVLTDDDFATIIRAVESGRRVYDNVRKFILYIFAHAVPEIVPFLLFALSGGAVPLGLTVIQILVIDLGTETVPALALGRERSEPGIMERPPRSRHEGIITGRMLVRAWAVLGTVSAVLVTAGYLWVLLRGGWHLGAPTGPGTSLHATYLQATTMTFAGIVACQIGTALAARTDHVSLLRVGLFSNRLLLVGILFELVVTAAVVYLPVAHDLLGTRSLGISEVGVLAVFPVVVWGADELFRAYGRRTPALPDPGGAAGVSRPVPASGSTTAAGTALPARS
ncbi:MAG: calcium-transporting ATPase [Marmoricola sp.]|nr:calcium-transporting ATPase [Marmoricola sp.]